MAYKALIFGVDDLYEKLKPLYDKAVKRGNLEIIDAVDISEKAILDLKPKAFDLAIISSHENFYSRMKQLEAYGVPRNRIIDGRVFQVPKLDFPRLLKEGVAYGVIENENSFEATSCTIYPQSHSFENNNSTLFLDKKSYLYKNASVERDGDIHIGKYSSLSWSILFQFQLNSGHNKSNISQYSRHFVDWSFPKEFMSPQGKGKILIGNDV